jgi:hypothetical protein
MPHVVDIVDIVPTHASVEVLDLTTVSYSTALIANSQLVGSPVVQSLINLKISANG